MPPPSKGKRKFLRNDFMGADYNTLTYSITKKMASLALKELDNYDNQ